MSRALRVLGTVLALASLAWLASVAFHHAAALRDLRWGPGALGALAAASALQVLTVVIGALSWRLLLRAAGRDLPLPAALVVTGLSQVGKYLPGNVGQYLGRLALARRHGIPAREVVVTVSFEAAWLVVAAALMTGVASLWAIPAGLAGTAARPLAIALLALAAVASPWLLARLLGRRFGGEPVSLPGPGTFAACLLLDGLSFLVSGSALELLAGSLLGHSGGLGRTTAVFAVAWVAGYVTPGSPGGLGVREALLVAGLRPIHGAAGALALALAFRLATTLGDALAFLAALGGGRLVRPASASDRDRSAPAA
jgi:hypothetical protein